MSTRACITCGAPAATGARFCSRCGNQLVPAESKGVSSSATAQLTSPEILSRWILPVLGGAAVAFITSYIACLLVVGLGQYAFGSLAFGVPQTDVLSVLKSGGILLLASFRVPLEVGPDELFGSPLYALVRVQPLTLTIVVALCLRFAGSSAAHWSGGSPAHKVATGGTVGVAYSLLLLVAVLIFPESSAAPAGPPASSPLVGVPLGGIIVMALPLAAAFAAWGGAREGFGRRWLQAVLIPLDGARFQGITVAIQSALRGLILALTGGLVLVLLITVATVYLDESFRGFFFFDPLQSARSSLVMVFFAPNLSVLAVSAAMGAPLEVRMGTPLLPIGTFDAHFSYVSNVPLYAWLAILVPTAVTLYVGYTAAKPFSADRTRAVLVAMMAAGVFAGAWWILTILSSVKAFPTRVVTVQLAPALVLVLLWSAAGAWIGALICLLRAQAPIPSEGRLR